MVDHDQIELDALANRYQNKPWYVKLWRMRWHLLRPYWAYRWYRFNHPRYGDTQGNAWSYAHGWAHRKMEYWYTSEECAAYFEEKFSER